MKSFKKNTIITHCNDFQCVIIQFETTARYMIKDDIFFLSENICNDNDKYFIDYSHFCSLWILSEYKIFRRHGHFVFCDHQMRCPAHKMVILGLVFYYLHFGFQKKKNRLCTTLFWGISIQLETAVQLQNSMLYCAQW